jgi:hypothetical protein
MAAGTAKQIGNIDTALFSHQDRIQNARLRAPSNPAVAVSVDANANWHPINPNIHGIAYGDAHDVATLNVPVN